MIKIKWLTLIFSSTFIVACGAFLLLAHKTNRPTDTVPANAPPLMNKPLPAANLVDSSGVRLEDSVLRHGKVVLVFVAPKCPACDTEIAFLKTVISQHSDVSFFGVVSFGVSGGLPKDLEKDFPFKLYTDNEPRLTGALGLYRVPIKVFLENGIIRKSWKGATTDEAERVAFAKWLDDPN
jgi:thiol-disulfide isomerase/thioredoxin